MTPFAARLSPQIGLISDRRLVERMTRGDEGAFRELLARYRSTVYAEAYAVLLDPEQVEAIVADAFHEARRTALEFLASRSTVSGWLTHLTRLCTAARLPRLQRQ
jgi:DNA-directed RNA polymerase specialized sigma24 family protein